MVDNRSYLADNMSKLGDVAMKLKMLNILLLSAVLAACSNQGASPSGEKTSQLAERAPAAAIDYKIDTVAQGLDHPWSLAFLPNGGKLVTQRTGKLLHINAAGESSLIYDFNEGSDYPKVHHGIGRQAGLFDVILHPDFANHRMVFISYAAEQGDDKNTLLLYRFNLSEDGKSISNGQKIFTASPARIQGNHYGARIAFLADGTLVMPVGDAFHFREEAQTLDNHFGKIIRINEDGSVPSDNPFINQEGAFPEIWSYGHRNPQGIIVTSDGRLLANEHGPAGGDEINAIKKGANYGWPIVTYALDYSGGRVSPFEALDGTEQSLVHFTPSIAPSGFAQYTGDLFPNWQGDLFLSALVLKHVRHVDMNADGTLGKQSELFGELNVRFRDVRNGPDGALYVLTEEGSKSRILRISPQP